MFKLFRSIILFIMLKSLSQFRTTNLVIQSGKDMTMNIAIGYIVWNRLNFYYNLAVVRPAGGGGSTHRDPPNQPTQWAGPKKSWLKAPLRFGF